MIVFVSNHDIVRSTHACINTILANNFELMLIFMTSVNTMSSIFYHLFWPRNYVIEDPETYLKQFQQL